MRYPIFTTLLMLVLNNASAFAFTDADAAAQLHRQQTAATETATALAAMSNARLRFQSPVTTAANATTSVAGASATVSVDVTSIFKPLKMDLSLLNTEAGAEANQIGVQQVLIPAMISKFGTPSFAYNVEVACDGSQTTSATYPTGGMSQSDAITLAFKTSTSLPAAVATTTTLLRIARARDAYLAKWSLANSSPTPVVSSSCYLDF